MKETYVKAEMEIVEFECEDVIRTSAPELPYVPYNPYDDNMNDIPDDEE